MKGTASIPAGRGHEWRLRDENKPGTGLTKACWPRRGGASGGNALWWRMGRVEAGLREGRGKAGAGHTHLDAPQVTVTIAP